MLDGAVLWKRDLPGEDPLLLILERSRLAPMEGELQLRFRFRSDLYVLTFSLAPGHLFNSAAEDVLFIGGVQGQRGSRAEIREASRRNCEIAPAAMLLLGIQAIAKTLCVGILAVGEADQISTSYSGAMMRFSYDKFWAQAGAAKNGEFYSLPLDPPARDLSTIPISHRARTKRKREEKRRIRECLEANIRVLVAGERERSTTCKGLVAAANWEGCGSR